MLHFINHVVNNTYLTIEIIDLNFKSIGMKIIITKMRPLVLFKTLFQKCLTLEIGI